MDSIIVYRNPMEKAMWESGNMHLVPIFAVAMGITFFWFTKLWKSFISVVGISLSGFYGCQEPSA